MIQNEESWSALAKYVKEILRNKKLLKIPLLGFVNKSGRDRSLLHAALEGGGQRTTYKDIYLFMFLFIYLSIR